jgi:RHS repeat-associated protein
MKPYIRTCLAALCVAINLAAPRLAQADASASSQLTINNLDISPTAGTFEILSNWFGGAYAQATVSDQYDSGTSPSVTETGDYSTANGSADATLPGAQSSANGSVSGPGADNAEGQGWVASWFEIIGGSGDVSTLFSAQINSTASVFTDLNGQLAQAENVFSLEVNGDPVLFNDQFFSIGPDDSSTQNITGPFSDSTTLQYNTPYLLYVEADSEISISSVPEPGAAGLLVAGTVACLWAGRKRLRGRRKELMAFLLLLGAGGAAQATYVGGDAPDVCQTCGVQPTRLPGGTISTSLTEGNLREDYLVTTLQSGSGPTLQFALVYNSYNADGSKMELDSGLGIGWTHSYNQFLFQQRGSWFKMGPDGRVIMYKFVPGGYQADNGYFETLTRQVDGSLVVSNKFQSWWRFANVPGNSLLVEGPTARLVQMGDRNGNVTTLTYTSGKLTQIQDTYGRSLTFTYASQHLQSITDPLGRTTTFQYDSQFRTPIRITDPDGNITRYSYNANYQMTRKIDRDGRSYFFLYRNLKPWAVMDGNGQAWFDLLNTNNWAVNRTVLAYSMHRTYLASTITNIDGNGNAWRYQYDTNGYVTRATDPDGATTSYTYDPLSRTLVTKTNADGAVTSYQYDSQGNRTNLTDALGNVTSYTYDPVFNQLTSLTDPNGRTTVYQYDSRGNETNEIDPLLQTRTWTYDAHGNVLAQTDQNGHITTYVYDPYGDRTNLTDALGHTTSYAYDAVGNLVQTTDPLGRSTTFAYDGLNRLIDQTNALGGVTTYTYDGDGRQTSVTDPAGRITQYDYDVRGRLIQTVDPLGGSTTYGYDANNNQLAATNQLGNPTMYIYDAQNRRVAQVDALGDVTTYLYDPVGNLTTNVDGNGHATVNTYDALNRRITTTDALENVTSYDYSMPGGPPCCSPTIGSSLITRLEDANGNVTFYNYDELNRLTEVVKKQGNTNDTITPSDAVTTYAYDPVGNRLATTDPVGLTTSYSYDAVNRIISSTNAAGDVTSYVYDPVGNVIDRTSPNGNVTTHTYDALNRTTSAYDGEGLVTTNTYDSVGNRLTQTDANGHTTTYTYDGLNRVIMTTDPLGLPSTTAYDAVDNVVTNVDRNGNATSYQYDPLNRRTSVYDALGNTTAYAYDAVGNVTNLTDANGHVTRYQYDAVNRRLAEIYPDSIPNTVAYSYDSVGNVVSRTDQKGQVTTYSYSQLYFLTNRYYLPSGSNDVFTYDLAGRTLSANRGGWVDTFGYDGANRLVYTYQNGGLITYSYDIAGRLQTNTYPSGRIIRQMTDGRSRLLTEQEAANPPIVSYTYDAADRVLSRTNGNGTFSTYLYDADNRVTALETSNSVGQVVGFGYAYDFDGNRLTELKRDSTADSEAYVYDGLNRLADYRVGVLSGNLVPSPTLERTWTLDPLDNWTTMVSNSVPETRTHGPANELLSINAQNFSYDADGNLTQDSTYNYAYDEENRLTQVQRISDLAVVGRYFYDALGRRVIAIPDAGAGATTNVYYYDNFRVIEEQNAGGVPQATYAYGNYVDEVLTMERGGQTYYYHQNGLWSPYALTDPRGNVIERYTYDAYGGVIVLDGSYNPLALNSWGTPHSAVGNPYLFTGRKLDEETGLYFYRARYYDAAKGRFLQRDPLDYDQGLNLYEYASSSPKVNIDPTGEIRADASAGLTHIPAYKISVWLEGESDDGCTLKRESIIPDKKLESAFTVTVGVITERETSFDKKSSACKCGNVQCVKYYLHASAVQGIGVSISGGGKGVTGSVSGTLITAQHDHYFTLEICADNTASAKVKSERTSGFSGDTVRQKVNANGAKNSTDYTFGDENEISAP